MKAIKLDKRRINTEHIIAYFIRSDNLQVIMSTGTTFFLGDKDTKDDYMNQLDELFSV